MSEKDIRNR